MQKKLETFLGNCARKAILRDNPLIIAIAGSVGKTSARNALTLALEASFNADEFRTSKKNYNNELGVPLSIFNCEVPGKSPVKWLNLIFKAFLYCLGVKKLNMHYLVLEMAADHPGDIDYLVKIAPPSIAIITAMGAEHTEFFGSIENAVAEERKILLALPEDGEAILNSDDEFCKDSKSFTKAEIVHYGKESQASVSIISSRVVYDQLMPEKAGLEMEFAVLKNHIYKLFLKGVYGEAHPYAIASAVAFCVSMDHMSRPVMDYIQSKYVGMPGRSRLIPGIKNTMLLDDSYNAQPQAMRAAINELSKFPIQQGAKRIAVLGEMLELGDISEKEHITIGRLVASLNIDFLVCCGTLARTIGQSALSSGMNPEKIKYFDSSAEAGIYIQQNVLKTGDVVLIKGSQGSRMEKVTKELMADPLQAEVLLVRQSSEWQ